MENTNKSSRNSPGKSIDADAANQQPKEPEKALHNPQPEPSKQEEFFPETPDTENIHPYSPPKTMEQINNNDVPKSASEKSVDANAAVQEPEKPKKTPNNTISQHELSEEEEPLPETPTGDDIPHTPTRAPLVSENPPKRRRLNPMESTFDGDEIELPPSVNP